jgi:photosystem II stability/assembly factor-like uncharacterized protein
MKDRIVFSADKKGIKRAAFINGNWTTELYLPEEHVQCFIQHRYHRNTILAGTQGNGIFSSHDSGKTWSWLGLKNTVVKSITTGRGSRGQIWAGVKPASLFVSDDDGKTWNEVKTFRRMPQVLSWFSPAEPPFTAYVTGLDISPEDEKIIIAGIEFGGVHRSDDGGKTWKGHMNGAIRDCHNLFIHRKYSGYVYQGGGTGAGAAISRDGGKTWDQYKDGLDRHYGWAVAADPDNPEIWYASVSSGPMKAHSPGNANAYIFRKEKDKPWKKLSGGLPDPLQDMPYTLAATEQPGFIIAGLINGDIWWSSDYGESWKQAGVNMGFSRTMLFIKS